MFPVLNVTTTSNNSSWSVSHSANHANQGAAVQFCCGQIQLGRSKKKTPFWNARSSFLPSSRWHSMTKLILTLAWFGRCRLGQEETPVQFQENSKCWKRQTIRLPQSTRNTRASHNLQTTRQSNILPIMLRFRLSSLSPFSPKEFLHSFVLSEDDEGSSNVNKFPISLRSALHLWQWQKVFHHCITVST